MTRHHSTLWELSVQFLFTLLFADAARAEVTIYGLADASVKVIDNFGGSRRVAQDSGDQQGPRLGFQGIEDLGEGWRTIFVLESGVGFDTGSLAQGGIAFGRQSYVGITSPHAALTLGRQYDFMVELGAFHAVQQGTGTLDWNVGDNDRVSGQRLNNGLKYVYQQGSLSMGALYSLSESTAVSANPSAASFLGKYAIGGWSMAAAATLMHNAAVAPFASMGVATFLDMSTTSPTGSPISVVVDRVDIYGAGVGYTTGGWSLMGLYTQTRYEDGAANDTMRNGSLAARYVSSSGLVYAAGVAKSDMGSDSWRRFALAADYFVSKRTDLYLYFVTEHASGPGVRAVLFTATPSSGDEQHGVVAGIRHKF